VIPHQVHVVWIGNRPNPHESYLESWTRLNPGWELRYWTDANLPRMRHRRIIDAIPHASGRVNVIRLELLARYGGVYSDADSECLRPLGPLVAGRQAVAMTGRRGGIQNATLACAPGDPWFTRLVDAIPGWFDRLRASKRNRHGKGVDFRAVFGTRYITPVLRGHRGLWLPDGRASEGRRRVICERHEQCDDTVIVHDQAGSWRAQLGGRRVRL